ncbi:MAG TPA: hypothetical protein VK824_04405, partial [Planctomycetota bacterium]|nr:hypothetical protein [Planctomycetota bacterium]
VMVPAGATHLFLSVPDQLFNDNSDPDHDFAVEIRVVGCWTDLGLGLAGASPAPVLAGTGTLIAGEPFTLALTGGKPNSSAALFAGFSAINLPFKGGTLVPAPNLLVSGLPTGAGGAFSLAGNWPAGLPSGFTLFFQEWVADATGPHGLTATNGLSATTP